MEICAMGGVAHRWGLGHNLHGGVGGTLYSWVDEWGCVAPAFQFKRREVD